MSKIESWDRFKFISRSGKRKLCICWVRLRKHSPNMFLTTHISWIYYLWARFWPCFNFVDFRAHFGHFPLVIKGKYVKHVCSKPRKTNIPIIISKNFLKSVLWRDLESTPTFCIFQLLCFSLHPNEQHDVNQWAPARGSLNG